MNYQALFIEKKISETYVEICFFNNLDVLNVKIMN